MKITSNESLLTVALHTLEARILPELAGDTQASAHILKQVLGELLKRELATPPLLVGEIETGEALAARIEAFCGEAGIALPAGSLSGDAPSTTSSFATLAARCAAALEMSADLATESIISDLFT